MKGTGRILKKIALWTIGLLLTIVLAVYVLIRLPGVQNYARKKAVAYLEQKLGSPVRVDRLRITFPKNILLEGVYFEDQQGDTLFAGEKLLANVHLYKLLCNTLEIGRLEFHGIAANVHQALDSTYNFDYILDAFSSENDEPSTESSPWTLSLDKILLDRVNVRYRNEPDATDAAIDVGRLSISIEDIDLAAQEYNIKSVELENTSGTFVQNKPLTTRESRTQDVIERDRPFGFDVQFGEAILNHVQFHYRNAISDVEADVDFGKVKVASNHLDLDQQMIDLKEITLENSTVTVAMGSAKNVDVVMEEAKKEIALESEVWNVHIGDVNLHNSAVVYDNFNTPPVTEGIDFSHLNVKDLNVDADNVNYAGQSIEGIINMASLEEKSGFNIKELRGDFQLSQHAGFVKQMHLKTNDSRIDADAEFKFPGLDSIADNPASLYQKTEFRKSIIALSDVYMLYPELKEMEPFNNINMEIIAIDAEVEGRLDDLRFGHMTFSGLGATEVQMSGTIRGLPDVDRTTFDLRIDKLKTNSKDIYALLPPETIPDSIRIPETLSARGTLRGNTQRFVADLKIQSSSGNAVVDGIIDLHDPMSVEGDFALDDFDIGNVFMRDSLLGNVTLQASGMLKGIGTDTMSGKFAGTVDRIQILDYGYQNIAFDGTSDHGKIHGVLDSKDPNLEFKMDAVLTLADSTLGQTNFTLDLARADLHALHLTDEQFVLHGVAEGDFSSLDPGLLNGTVAFRDLTFSDSAREIKIDTLSITSLGSEGQNKLSVSSDFLSLEMSGDYQLDEVFTALNRSIGKYFGTPPEEIVAEMKPQRFELEGELRYSPLFAQIDTNIGSFAPVRFKGRFDSAEDQLSFSGASEQIQYKPASIHILAFDIETKGEALHYIVRGDALKSDAISFHKSQLEGDILDGDISSTLSVRDNADNEQFRMSMVLQLQGTGFVLSLKPEGLMLNYEDWTITKDNEIRYDTNALAVRNFILSNASQRLSIHSEPPGVNHPIAIAFDNFNIETITRMISSDSLLAGGVVNGRAMVRDYFTSPVFTADLSIADLSYQGDTIGDLNMEVNNETTNTLFAKMNISGGGNAANVEGRYLISSESLDLAAHITELKLSSVEGFSMGMFSDAHGIVRGELNISGKVLKPVVEGNLEFDSASVYVTQLNARYVLAKEGVRFADSDIHFKNFTITDEEANELHCNGVIYTETFSNFTFALDIDSENFKVLNTQAHENDLYYGTLYLDSRIRIRGAMNKPEINADLDILDKTKMTIIVPQTDPGIVEREGIVSFVDLDHPGLDSIIAISLDSLNTSSLRGLVAFANIKVTDASEFTLVIDPGSGDLLRLRGNAELNASLDPSGKISLTGNYVLKEGIYELSFNFIKRRFDIRSGSTITWNGEPTSGEIDITAVYVVDAAPIDLVENQIAGATQTETNYYKEKLPFELLLSLTGTLLRPEVAFDITLPEGNYAVSPEVITTIQAKLQQLSREESEVNKQAFALVILNRFISEDPFHSAAGGTSAVNYARQSVSKLLSQQLNNLTANLVSGVDLNFDLESTEDYSTGQLQNRTDLNVSASKRLLDDRITVTVGSNFELEGSEQPSEKANTIAGDISVEYQLSKDGRYLLRAYRKNEYQVAVEGNVIKTGLSFVIQLDYDKFVEIFRSSKKKSEKN